MSTLGIVDITFTANKQLASNANETANNANETANNANEIANNANDTANNANETAQTAQETADNANQTANNAQQTATIALESANGKNKTFYGSTEPENPQSGDSWFKQDENGVFVALYHYDGTQWVLDVDGTAISQLENDVSNALSQANSAMNTANQANANAQSAIDKAQEGFDIAQSALSTANQANSNVQSAIDKAQEGFDAAQDALSATNSLAERMTDAEGNISYLQTTSSSFATRITDAEGNISTLTQTVDGLQETVSTKVDEDTYNSFVTQTSQALQSKLSVQDAASTYATQSSLTQTANSLTSKITSVQTNLDNLQIGGANLAPNSTGDLGTDGWRAFNGSTNLVVSDGYQGHKSVSVTVPSANGAIYTPFGNVEGSGQYTMSFWVKADKNCTVSHLPKFLDSNNVETNPLTGSSVNLIANTWTKVEYTFIAPSTAVKAATTPRIGSGTFPTNLFVSRYKLEKGAKATDWTPAAEDMATVIQFNTLSQTLDSTTSRIGNAEGNISALQQTANSLATRVETAEGNITTLTQTTNGLQTTVSGKVDTTTYNSFVTQTNSALQSKLSIQDAANTYATQSSLTQTATSLTSKITSVQTNLDNLQIGGRNLFLNSDFSNGYSNWNPNGSATLSVLDSADYGHVLKVVTTGTAVSGAMQNVGSKITYNEEYTVSLLMKADAETTVNIQNSSTSWLSCDVTTEWKLFTVTIKPTNSTTIGFFNSSASTFYMAYVKIEKGNKATDWTPAPEDMATQSQISQLSDDINLRVQKNDVINQINVSTESILISGNKVHITGQTTIDNAVITSAMIQSLDATKINATSLSAISANLGSVTAGSISGVSMNIGNGKFVVDTNGNLTATSATITGNIIGSKITSSGSSGNVQIYQDTISTYSETTSGSVTTKYRADMYSGAISFNYIVGSDIYKQTAITSGRMSIFDIDTGETTINGNTVTTVNLSVSNITTPVNVNDVLTLTYGSSEVSALVSSGQIQSVSFYSTGASTFNQILTGNLTASRGGAINLNNGDIIGANGIYLNDAANVDGEGLVFPWSTSTNVLDVTQADCLRAYNGRLLLNGDVVHTEKSMMIATGYVVVTPSAPNTPTYKTISFGKTFPVVPNVVVTPNSTVAGTTVTGWAVTDVTTTGCKIWVTRGNTTDVGIHWIAIADNTAWTANAVG